MFISSATSDTSNKRIVQTAHPPIKEVRSEKEFTESMLYRRLRCLIVSGESPPNDGRVERTNTHQDTVLQQPLSSLLMPNKTRARQRRTSVYLYKQFGQLLALPAVWDIIVSSVERQTDVAVHVSCSAFATMTAAAAVPCPGG